MEYKYDWSWQRKVTPNLRLYIGIFFDFRSRVVFDFVFRYKRFSVEFGIGEKGCI